MLKYSPDSEKKIAGRWVKYESYMFTLECRQIMHAPFKEINLYVSKK